MATRDLVLSCISKSKILKWHVRKDESIKKDCVIATYVFTEKISDASNFIVQRKLKAKFNGKIIELSVKPNDDVARGQVVARLLQQDCEHNTVMKDMCCDCGEDLRKEAGIPGDLSEPITASVPVVHNILELKVSVEEAEKLARYDEQQLLRARKLVLVVDLDMTLVHTTIEPVAKGTQDVFSFILPGHQYEYHTKLRPGARKFLESISKFYELHIFTMGSRMYAHTVAKRLDPDGKFFAHRIRSRDEFINSFSKFHDLKALFPCGDHMVCIIDDREDVWNFAPNLVTVKPYKFFKGSDDVNDPFKHANVPLKEVNAKDDNDTMRKTNADDNQATKDAGNDLNSDNNNPAENTASERRSDLDDYLFYLDEILERVHFSFYSTLDAVKNKGGSACTEPEITKFCTYNSVNPDVRVILPELKRQTLKGCNLVFTGVVPTNCPLEKSKAWKTAVSLGARVTSDIVTSKANGCLSTTHVVAARHGTHKSHKAFRDPNIHLVNPNWLWCCGERWEWAEEGIFPVPLSDNKSPVLSRQSTPQHEAFETVQKEKKISPLADDAFEIKTCNPNNFLQTLNPLTSFSKNELDAMDREVEEFMSVDGDSDGSCKERKFISGSPPTKKRKLEEGECGDSSSDKEYSSSTTSSSASSSDDQLGTLLETKMIQ